MKTFFFFLENTLIFGEKRLLKEVMELNTFFHYGAVSIFKSSKGAAKKKFGNRCSKQKKRKKVFTSINLVFRYFSSKIIVISKNLKFKISRPPLNHFATHQGVATPSLKSPALKNKGLHFKSVSDFMVWITLPSTVYVLTNFVPCALITDLIFWPINVMVIFYILASKATKSEFYQVSFELVRI